MPSLSAFTFITLNGYYQGPQPGDISWHRHGEAEAEFSETSLSKDNILLFGHNTYNMMAGYWPTEQALAQSPAVAKGMNAAEKIVFSRSMRQAEWQHTRVINANLVEEIRALKQHGKKDLTILGSGSILTQVADHELIDEYLVMIDPVALGDGFPIFKGMQRILNLELQHSRVFPSGTVLLGYKVLAR